MTDVYAVNILKETAWQFVNKSEQRMMKQPSKERRDIMLDGVKTVFHAIDKQGMCQVSLNNSTCSTKSRMCEQEN